MHAVKAGLVAYVRLVEGGTAKLHEGDPVPPEADPAHVALLVARGVLAEVEEPKQETGSRSRRRSSSSSETTD